MPKISYFKACAVFCAATVYFYTLLFTLLPFVKANFTINSALYWFITGYFLFVPLFFAAILFARKEGNSTAKQIFAALSLRKFYRRDWLYALGGLLAVFLGSGVVFACAKLATVIFGIRELSTVPWFMEITPFQGRDKLLLLVWLPMFFFNICGEELLWRGYIQSRLKHRHSWILCSMLWLIFHLPFGLDLLLMLLPIVIILPYVFHRSQNTLIGIFIHGIFNGPIFVAVALGLVK